MYWTGIIITAVLLSGYGLLLLLYLKWWLQLPLFTIDHPVLPRTFFSVVIPARNEEENIQPCLRSVLEQQYPLGLLEVIVINDHSTDQTENIIREMQQAHTNLQLINLADHVQGKQFEDVYYSHN